MSVSDLPSGSEGSTGTSPGTSSPGADPAPFEEPSRKATPAWIAGVVLVNLGINAAFFGPIQVLLGQQAVAFDESNKEAILALVTGCGAAVALVANPLFGAFSDRSSSRFGRRVPWVVAGAVLGTVALLALAGAPNVAVMTLLWCLVQAGCNGAYAAITATIPDRVPVRQRGVVGGLASMGQTVGILAGAVIAALVSGNFSVGFIICAAALLAGVVPYVLNSHDVPILPWQKRFFSLSGFVAGFWISPVKHPDFAWAWLTRFLVNVGNHLVTLYLLFFLRDSVRYPRPEEGVLVLTGLYAVMVIVTALIGGPWSDRVDRRKPFVIGSSAIIALASLILAFAPSWTGALIGSTVLGIGFGAYLAVDFALLTQVLPSAADRGKDLGIINVANSLPQVIAPVLAAPIVLFLGGYITLYVVAAVIGLLGAVFVIKIRGVR